MYHYPSVQSLGFQLRIFRPVDGAHSPQTGCCSCYSDFSLCLSWVISLDLSSSPLILFSAVSLLLMSLWKARFISVSDFLSHLIFFFIVSICLLKFSHLILHRIHLGPHKTCYMQLFFFFYVPCLIIPTPESDLCVVLMLILSLCSLWIFFLDFFMPCFFKSQIS